jgi:hypothetical protein
MFIYLQGVGTNAPTGELQRDDTMTDELIIDGTGSNDQDELVFIPYWEQVRMKKNAKTGASFEIGSLIYNNKTSVIALTDTSGEALGTFTEHHPSAKFTGGKPDGLRLLGAVARHHKLKGSVQEIVDGHNEAVGDNLITLNIKKTDKGVLWTIQEDA